MVIKINYTSSDVYVSTSVSPVYVVVNYSGVSGGGGAVWGEITGTLSDQTDLQTALDGKFDDPTGDTTQYIAGDGSLVAFPIAGQSGTLVREVRNITGATLTKGTVVYINGASGNKPTVTKAIATGDTTSAQTFGIVQADITNNSNGYVVAVGDIDGLNTSAFADGAQLYLSATTAGAYTDVKQYAPNHLVYIGVITRSHPTQGRIEVRIQNGYELDELHNVSAQSPANNDALIYESSTSLWKNKTIATALGYTPQAALTLTTTGTSGAATLVGATLNIPQYSGGGGGTPGGSNTQIQYNNSGAFGGSAGLVYSDSAGTMTLSKNQNAGTFFEIKNTTAGTGSYTRFAIYSDYAQPFIFQRYSSTSTTFSWILPNDSLIYQNEQNICIASDSTTKAIKFLCINVTIYVLLKKCTVDNYMFKFTIILLIICQNIFLFLI